MSLGGCRACIQNKKSIFRVYWPNIPNSIRAANRERSERPTSPSVSLSRSIRKALEGEDSGTCGLHIQNIAMIIIVIIALMLGNWLLRQGIGSVLHDRDNSCKKLRFD